MNFILGTAWISFFLLSLLGKFLITYWVKVDGDYRGETGWLWACLFFSLPVFFGLLLYYLFVYRHPKSKCPVCGATFEGYEACPYCGEEVWWDYGMREPSTLPLVIGLGCSFGAIMIWYLSGIGLFHMISTIMNG